MTTIHEIDYGTPARASDTLVTLEIDGRSVTVPEGTSLMRAAVEAGVMVPKLCATDHLEAFGSCRLCMVEIEGRRGTPASCTTPVAPGFRVVRPLRMPTPEEALVFEPDYREIKQYYSVSKQTSEAGSAGAAHE